MTTETVYPPFAPEAATLPPMLPQGARKTSGHLFLDCPALEVVNKAGRTVKACEWCLSVFADAGRRGAAAQRAFDAAWTEEEEEEEEEEAPIPQPAPSPTVVPPTNDQMGLLGRLFAERRGLEPIDEMRQRLLARHAAGLMSKGDAIAAIAELRKVPANDRSEEPAHGGRALPDVADGHYALPSSGTNDLVFYRVTSSAKWGKSVQMVIGGQLDRFMGRKHVPGVLARIAADPGSAERFGQNIRFCVRCNRRLTNERSRAANIGPECAKAA